MSEEKRAEEIKTKKKEAYKSEHELKVKTYHLLSLISHRSK